MNSDSACKRKRDEEEELASEEITSTTAPPPKRQKYSTLEHGIFRDTIPTSALDSISVTSTCGADHVFVTLLPDDIESTSHVSENDTTGHGMLLLGKPLSEIIDKYERMEEEQRRKVLVSGDEQDEEQPDVDMRDNSMLFVDKYAPKSFTDLLTNDQVNREVLKWVKEWDPIVFPEKVKKPVAQASKNHTEQVGPEQRILLMSGPPGIGKTTLAHIVARQAGYRAVEINASDDRSSTKLVEAISQYTQTQSVFGDKRPVCLIIDEIDGLQNSQTKSAVSDLLKMAYPPKKKQKETKSDTKSTSSSSAPKGKTASDNNAKKKKETKRKKKKGSSLPKLNRPIICICNDHYVPALRELRQRSKLFVFRRKDTLEHHNIERLVSRISNICISEGLSFNKRWLRELVVKSDGDIRSCLNTIQFMANGNEDTFSLADKDSRKDFFDIMGKIFDKRDTTNSTTVQKPNLIRNMSEVLLDEGDRYETLLMACFENYPSVRYNYSLGLSETTDVLEWTSWGDNVTKTMKRTQTFALNSYNVYPIIQYHLRCAAMYKQAFSRYNYPKRDGDVRREREQRVNICRSMFSNEITEDKQVAATSSCRQFFHHPVRSSSDMQLDVVPHLVTMLYPTQLMKSKSSYINNLMFSADNSSLESIKVPSEKLLAQNIVDICVDYGLSFRYSSEGVGGSKLELDPPVHKLNNFESHKAAEKGKPQQASNALDLPYSLKKIIAQEVRKEKLKRAIQQKQPSSTPAKPDQSTKKNSMASPPVRTPSKKSHFTSSPTSSPTSSSDYTLYFSFHEGVTNAIRRPAKLRSFL